MSADKFSAWLTGDDDDEAEPFTAVEFAAGVPLGLMPMVAKFLALYPYYGPWQSPTSYDDCFCAIGHWYRFWDWMGQQRGWPREEIERSKRLLHVYHAAIGRPSLPRTFN